MTKRAWNGAAAFLVLLTVGTTTRAPAAESAKFEDKPPLYTYISHWDVPRAQWPALNKTLPAINRVLAGAGLTAFGTDETLLHQVDGDTHTVWWSGLTMGTVLDALEQLRRIQTPVLDTALRHWDGIYVSRFYRWRPGSSHGYIQKTAYRVKAGAPDDALEVVCESIFLPLLEKLYSEGVIVQYQVDVQAEHTQAPGVFWISVTTATSQGLDQLNAAITEIFVTNPLVSPTFSLDVDFAQHRDFLSTTDATYR
jgi:hypothetical protein